MTANASEPFRSATQTGAKYFYVWMAGICLLVAFVGFAPTQSPAVVCGIVLDDPDTCRSGAQSAAPAFQQVMRQIISHPDLEYAELILQQSSPPSKQPAKKKSPSARPS